MRRTIGLFSDPQKRFVLGITVWATLTLAGFAGLARYSNTPGDLGAPSHLNQSSLPISNHEGKYILVMAIHPKCPCTRASIGELERILRYAKNQVACVFLVYQPPQAAENWRLSGTVFSARQISNSEVVYDESGKLAKQLGMATSGSVVLFAPAGNPVFHGGITPSRNHHGDNLGSDVVLAIIRGETPFVDRTDVYGCPIHADSLCRAEEKACDEDRKP